MFLGIDVGTTATKAVLAGADHRAVASATATYALHQPSPDVSELDPGAWVDAVRAVVGRIREAAPRELAAVRAVGLSGQMHSFVLLGGDDRPLRPAILWNDDRGEAEARALREDVPGIARLTGVVPMPSFTAAKLLWLKNHERAAFDRARGLLWPKDFVRLWLTGERATDVSDAAGGQLLDEARRRWADPVVDHLGLDRRCLPRLLEGTEPSGALLPAAAAELGLPAGVPVAAGGGDSATGPVGLGCVRQGQAFISLGTGAVFAAAEERYRPEPEKLLHAFAHCLPARWYRMAAMLNGGSCLAWVARICREPDLEAFLARVARRGPAPGRVLFQPYLRGERTPHNDVSARGAFVGLDAACEAEDLAKAVLEGVAFSLRLAHDLLVEGGEPLGFVGLSGGGSRSALWCELIACVLGRPLAVFQDSDFASALGAARLGMAACGARPVADVAPLAAVTRTVNPDPGRAAAYAERFEAFRELYGAVRGLA